MPSSRSRSSKKSQQPIIANSWFTLAAIERIAKCLTGDLTIGDQNASAIITRYLASDRSSDFFGLAKWDFVRPLAYFWYDDGFSDLPQVSDKTRFYYFAGLLEIATASGYSRRARPPL
jgi:hypothetical protein